MKRLQIIYPIRISCLVIMAVMLILTACAGPKPEANIRVLNLTDKRLADVRIQFPDGEVVIGDMLPHTNSTYQLFQGAYADAPVTLSTSDGDFTYTPTISEDAEPLAEGNYTYAIHFANGNIVQGLINDTAPHADADLADYWLWTETNHADGSTSTPASNGVEPSGILLTSSPSLNEALEGNLFGAYTGCNSSGGAFFTTPQNDLIMQMVTFSGEECSEKIDSAEKLILQAIDGITTYEVNGDILNIFISNGDTLILERN